MEELNRTDTYIFNTIVECIRHCKKRFECVENDEEYVRFYVVMESNSNRASTQSVYHSLSDTFKKLR